MRYYIWLGTVLIATGLLLGGNQLLAWRGNVDVTIPIKDLNQKIAPAALSCPKPYYPSGSTIECTLQGVVGRRPIGVRVTGTAVEFISDRNADAVMEWVTGFDPTRTLP